METIETRNSVVFLASSQMGESRLFDLAYESCYLWLLSLFLGRSSFQELCLFGISEDLLAQALEMELEIDGRLRLQRDSASQLHQLEVAHGIFSWSTTRVFLVDALNEASQFAGSKLCQLMS